MKKTTARHIQPFPFSHGLRSAGCKSLHLDAVYERAMPAITAFALPIPLEDSSDAATAGAACGRLTAL